MKILALGESVIDKTQLSQGGEEEHVGGPMLSASVLLSRMGENVTLLTAIGKDREGDLIRKSLEKEGVRTIFRYRERTKINKVLVDTKSGERKKLRGSIKHAPCDISREFLQDFDLLLFDRHEKEAFYRALKYRSPHAKIVIDPSNEVSPFTKDMIRYADYPVLPIESLREFGENISRSLHNIHLLCKRPFIVTAGATGSMLYDNGKVKIFPSVRVRSVDATGAGDIYRGGLAYGISKNWILERSMRFANLLAGLQCTRKGNLNAIPTKEEIELFQRTLLKKHPFSMQKIKEEMKYAK